MQFSGSINLTVVQWLTSEVHAAGFQVHRNGVSVNAIDGCEVVD